ncbi:abortive infection family protein [Yersinia kristensenii]|uniref:Abortive infection protein-like C-terminal domain-containing protein n=1 Tax=Yersinia kristensenii TaxID=28152 RepID=A0A0T9KX10_YERKR|nr:abortive infection family protein [Yersinia kristensenii]CNE38120.1 Uncharacterised protein [Yersinia kristensenii]
MQDQIPQPLISIVADYISNAEVHASLNNLFAYADAPGEPPDGSKATKALEWLRRINKESPEPFVVLGKLIENYMEAEDAENETISFFGEKIENKKFEFKQKIEKMLAKYGYRYLVGGIITDGSSAPSQSLQEAIRGRNVPAIEAEFNRALEHVFKEPKESVSAACNILESVFKIFITDEQLEMPAKQDLQNVWKVVRENLGMDSKRVEDDDLKRILSGLSSVVDGIGALRTHASTAHGAGRNAYNIKPRHARLAINSAHTFVLFILETWDERKNVSSK